MKTVSLLELKVNKNKMNKCHKIQNMNGDRAAVNIWSRFSF